MFVDFVERMNWLPRKWDARTLLNACEDIELKIIYVGKFRPWSEEAQLMQDSVLGDVTSQVVQ